MTWTLASVCRNARAGRRGYAHAERLTDEYFLGLPALAIGGLYQVDARREGEGVARGVHAEAAYLRAVQGEYPDILHRAQRGDDYLAWAHGVDGDGVLQLVAQLGVAQEVTAVAVAADAQLVAIAFQPRALAGRGVVEVERGRHPADAADGEGRLVVARVVDAQANVANLLHGVHLRRPATRYGVDHRGVQLGVEQYHGVLRSPVESSSTTASSEAR